MSKDLWDSVLQDLEENDRAEDRSAVWDHFEGLELAEGTTEAGTGIWERWDQTVDNNDLSWVRESPSKKRKSRMAQEANPQRGWSRKIRRQNPEDTPITALSNELNISDDVFPSAQIEQVGPLGFEDNIAFSADDLEAYIAHFVAENVGFIPIGTYLYAIQGWNKGRREPSDKWYHFEGRRLGEDVRLTCRCPDGSNYGRCVHTDTYLEFREEEFRQFEEKIFRDGQVVWFWRELESSNDQGSRMWFNRFSVAIGNPGTIGVNGRTMVTFLGSDIGAGIWICAECSGTNGCPHRTAARRFFQEVMGIINPDDIADGEDSESLGSEDNVVICECVDIDKMIYIDQKTSCLLVDEISRARHHEEPAISYRAIRPPTWAELPWDLVHYDRPVASSDPPERIPSGGFCRSACGSISPTTDREKVVNTCIVYTTTGALTREIELVQCHTCPSRKRCFLGPDPRELGLFNYNNSIIFTHELLDEYTSRFTTCETPFVAFVESMSRVYEGRGSVFVKEDLFRSVWFAYVSVQDYSQDMYCLKCGEEPDCLIWDGVSLGFGRKHIQDSLRPPTYTDNSSPNHGRTYPHKPQLIPQDTKQPLRNLIRRWVSGAKRKRKDERSDGSEDETDRGQSVVQDYEVIRQRLTLVSRELGVLFERTLSPHEVVDPSLKRCYGNFFAQVAAEESVLQMVNAKCIPMLEDFVLDPTWQKASKLVDVPAVYNVLESEFRKKGQYPEDLLEACRWISSRAKTVLSALHRTDIEGLDIEKSIGTPFNDDWKQTGCCYSLPQIRQRPTYPKLKGDGGLDNTKTAERGGKCAKYYSTYGKHRLTGGIMAVWCTHSVCYGFHCIATAEGRNDVFSAMYTRWPNAPDRVVYDFACALAPYCMTREPRFFSGTQFLIDKFHAPGHTKCSSACFLSNYIATDSSLDSVNSSAAECGNSGISRIRKSVSYMRQNRAILYTKTFLSVWNRGQMRRGMGKMSS
ncbi:hypothetical protein PM082_013793 [Marasmius tenuissimus]|nr:hypothetical protein PM082_013793 [Marasmius tenuissimus]